MSKPNDDALRQACEAFIETFRKSQKHLLYEEQLATVLRFARTQQAEGWREAARQSREHGTLIQENFTAMAFNDACKDLADWCEAQARELEGKP